MFEPRLRSGFYVVYESDHSDGAVRIYLSFKQVLNYINGSLVLGVLGISISTGSVSYGHAAGVRYAIALRYGLTDGRILRWLEDYLSA